MANNKKMWVQNEDLIITKGVALNYEFMKEYALELEKANGWYIEKWALDPYNATQLMHSLIEHGYEVHQVRQGKLTLSQPTKNLAIQVDEGNVYFLNDGLFNWAMSNAVLDKDINDNVQVCKITSTGKVDPVCAAINGFVYSEIVDLVQGGSGITVM